MGANCWKELVREFSQDVAAVTRLEPTDPKEIVSETLVEALNIATNTNLSLRSTEALQTFLQRCDELNERELVGLCKIVSDLSMLGKSNVDGILLDLLKHVVRTGTKETETRQRNDTKMRFSDDSALATNHKSRRQTLDLPHHAQKNIDGSDGRS